MSEPRKYSFSSLSSAYSCQQLYKYIYLDKIKPPVEQTGDMAFGSAIHFALEQQVVDKSDPVAAFEVYWSHEIKKHLKYGRYNHETLREMGGVLLRRFIKLHAHKISPLSTEKRLYTKLGGFDVEGTPDVVGDFEGKMSVIDFKTSGSRYHRDKALVSEQMVLYAYLAMQELKIQVDQIVYLVFIKGSIPTIQVIKHDINSDTVARCTDNVLQQIDEIERRIAGNHKFSRNTNNCIKGEFVCPFFDRCWRSGK